MDCGFYWTVADEETDFTSSFTRFDFSSDRLVELFPVTNDSSLRRDRPFVADKDHERLVGHALPLTPHTVFRCPLKPESG